MPASVKRALVCGAGGFIGSHLVRRLKREGFWVRGVDLKFPEFSPTDADDFIKGDLRDFTLCRDALRGINDVYQLAADMGGAGFVFTGEHDAAIMHNSAQLNLNVVPAASLAKVRRLFYASSACIYPEYNQADPDNPNCAEDSAYPALPDSDYGWEKLFSERLNLAYQRNEGLEVRIARFHNIFGPEGTWEGGREKAPAALCRKVAEAADGDTIEIWGDGKQTRSFLYIDECLEGVRRLVQSDFRGPVNVGSDEMVSIDELAAMICRIAGKRLRIVHIPGPTGVRGRTSDNRLIEERLGWRPSQPLEAGMRKTYEWIAEQVAKRDQASSGSSPASSNGTESERTPIFRTSSSSKENTNGTAKMSTATVPILGCAVSQVTLHEAVDKLDDWIKHPLHRPRFVVATGFHGLWEAYKNPAFRRVLNSADLFCPDGIAPVWLSRAGKHPLAERVPGPDLLATFLQRADAKGFSSYFFGDTTETLNTLRRKVESEYPGHRVAGIFSPPFGEQSEEEERDFVSIINRAKPDVLWVALGLPKQEWWIHRHLYELKVPVVVGIGAAFGFLSGAVKRAPQWVGNAGFEWLWRLGMEPRKLWKRDLFDGPKFVYCAVREILIANRQRPAPGAQLTVRDSL